MAARGVGFTLAAHFFCELRLCMRRSEARTPQRANKP